MVWKVLAVVVVCLVVAMVGLLLSVNRLLNGVVKERLLRAANSQPGISLSLGTLHYSGTTSLLTCDSLRLHYRRPGSGRAEEITASADSFSCTGLNWFALLLGDGLQCGDVALSGVRAEIVQRQPERPASEAHEGREQRGSGSILPDRLIPLHVGRLSLRGGTITRIMRTSGERSVDSVAKFELVIADLSIKSGTPERSAIAPMAGRVTLRLDRAAFRLPDSPYRIACSALRLSGPDSSLSADSLTMVALEPDRELFRRAPDGATRVNTRIGRLLIRGVSLPGIAASEEYAVRSLLVDGLDLNIAVNRTDDGKKNNGQDGKGPADTTKMPNELLTRLHAGVRLDSLLVERGAVTYQELFPYSATPAVLHWDQIRLHGEGISNGRKNCPPTIARIEASSVFMDTARMKVAMELPLAEREFQITYSGSLSRMPLPVLNRWLTVSDRTRLKSGMIDSVTFSVKANHGIAQGTVRPLYRNLKIEVLEKQSGKSSGVPQRLGTFVANAFKIKDTNAPGDSGGPKDGNVHYARKPDDPFFGFVWLALRDGLKHVVGF